MIERVKTFIPSLNSDSFMKHGTAGIRTPVISPEDPIALGILHKTEPFLIISPLLILTKSKASDIQIGIEAAVVFPYLWILL